MAHFRCAEMSHQNGGSFSCSGNEPPKRWLMFVFRIFVFSPVCFYSERSLRCCWLDSRRRAAGTVERIRATSERAGISRCYVWLWVVPGQVADGLILWAFRRIMTFLISVNVVIRDDNFMLAVCPSHQPFWLNEVVLRPAVGWGLTAAAAAFYS